MTRIFIIAIMGYLIFLACYLLWERSVKRKMNAAKKPTFNPFKSSPKEDIMGKSKFILGHSRTDATTLIISDKRVENTATFAPEITNDDVQTTPVAVPDSKLDEVFSSDNSDEDSGEIDIEINDEPEGEFESEDTEDEKDYDESEDADETSGVVSRAQGLQFDSLSEMMQTVENHETATEDEKIEAGRVIIELRYNDMFEQIVSGEPKKKVAVTEFIDDYLAAFHRRKQEESGETNEPIVRAPKDFEMSAYI